MLAHKLSLAILVQMLGNYGESLETYLDAIAFWQKTGNSLQPLISLVLPFGENSLQSIRTSGTFSEDMLTKLHAFYVACIK